MSRWIKIAVGFIKTRVGQWSGRLHLNAPSGTDSSAPAKDLTASADNRAVRTESQIVLKTECLPKRQEIERRREIVRQFFNDFWISTDNKPVTFAERLNRAEGYINGRLAADGEAWQLDAATRQQLGL